MKSGPKQDRGVAARVSAWQAFRLLPRNVAMLGVVSLCMDVSSEMIHGLLPLFLVSVLGASALSVGIVEGLAEAAISTTKIFSGVASDWIGRRKPIVALGYGLAALSKPLFPLAANVGTVLVARFVDRIGKGIREAPRDAMMADVTPGALRGAAFGLRQALDTVGAFLGPLAAIALMAWSGDDFRLVFWIAVVPALLAVAVMIFGVAEPARGQVKQAPRFPIRRSELARLPAAFWWTVTVAAVFSLARFSEAFLVLKAGAIGVDAAYAPAVYVLMNLVYAATAYPFGVLADRIDRRRLLLAAAAVLVLADVAIAGAEGLPAFGLGVALWGLHLGASQGLLSALVADAAPEDLRGTAFGLFNLAVGAAALLASTGAGLLWKFSGPGAVFAAGAALAAAAAVMLAVRARPKIAPGPG